MKTESLVRESLLFPKQEFSSFEEVVEHVGGKMLEEGLVKESYVDAVITREKDFPTGLEMPTGGISIPHTDREHVNESAIGIVTLKKPIMVHSMINPKEEVKVTILFVLAVKDPEGQIEMLKRLMSLFQDSIFKEEIESASTKEELINILKKTEI